METRPATCLTCGNATIVPVVPCGSSDVREGRSVLVYGLKMDIYSGDFPDYVCVTCEPEWLDFSRLCQQIETLDVTKENHCVSQEFAAAAAARDAADLLRPGLQQLAMELLTRSGGRNV